VTSVILFGGLSKKIFTDHGIRLSGEVVVCLVEQIDYRSVRCVSEPRSMNTGDPEFAKAGTGPSVSDMGRLTGKPPLEGAVRGGRIRVDRSLPRLCQATVARSADSSDRAIGPSEPRNTRAQAWVLFLAS
jgi:hypothetical protein